MARHFIADSEDEEEDVSPLSPPPVTLPALAAGQSSDPLSRGTDSTDIAFFKTVYEEQAEAVQECAKYETKATRHASTKRVSGGGEGMWDVPSSPDAQPASSRRKRRKISIAEEEASPSLGVGDESEAGSGMLPPTLQIDNEAAFVITPNIMTKSQREAYQDIDYGSSLDRGPTSTLQGLGQRLLDIASSSSGTNLNTPRTVGGLTQLANTQDLLPTAPVDTQQDELAAQETVVPRPRRLSSPDVIAMAETTDLHNQHHEPTGDDEDARAQALSARDEDDLEEYNEPIVIGDDDDSPFEDVPVKPRKKRGRPKKPKSDDAAHHVESEPAVSTITEKPGKKKRGRPRKSHLTPEKAVQLTASEPEAEGGLDECPRPEAKVSKHTKDAKEEEAETNTIPDRQRDQSLLKMEKSREAADTKPIVASQQVEEPSKGHDEKGIKAEKGKCSQIGAKEEGKPVYRVGLSKRTRIAPLLKIIRK